MKGQQRYSFRIFLLLVFMYACAAILGGCTKPASSRPPTPPNLPRTTSTVPKKYLALGDSYTIGQSVALQERFPHQTAAWLRLKGIQMNEPDYIATTGWTTANLLSAIAAQKPATNYDAVSLLIGVNNQYQQRDTQEYRSQFTQCLLKAIELANNQRNRVLVLSIPDYSATPFASRLDRQKISREIDVFNAINKQVCTEYAIVWIEITQSSRDALTNPLLVANDGLHPSGMEYAKWAAKLAPAMETVLK